MGPIVGVPVVVGGRRWRVDVRLGLVGGLAAARNDDKERLLLVMRRLRVAAGRRIGWPALHSITSYSMEAMRLQVC